ncbi:MAG: hypothetical protein JO242_11080 [Streptosporangiaceae bacterium]|nr:hypothetical protein [Streptosporangiaceae bacterium]
MGSACCLAGEPGRDKAKKVNGRKRHIAVSASRLLLEVLVTPPPASSAD